MLTESPTHRAELREVLLESLAQHLLLVACPEEVHTQEWTVVKQTPLKVALKRWLGACVSPGELDANHTTTCL